MSDQGEREIHLLSKEYVKVRVTEPELDYDPGTIEVKVGAGDWRATDVLTARDNAGVSRVGFVCEPQVDELPVGNHAVLVRIVDNPETPVFPAGVLTVTP